MKINRFRTLEINLSYRTNWKSSIQVKLLVRKWDLWYFNLWMRCYSHPPPTLSPKLIFHGSHKKPAVSWPNGEDWPLWNSVKSNIPRAQSIFCLILQLLGKSLFLRSCGYLIWLRFQHSRGKKALFPGHFQDNSHLQATLQLLKVVLSVGVSKRRQAGNLIKVPPWKLDNHSYLWKAPVFQYSKRLQECTGLAPGETWECRRS